MTDVRSTPSLQNRTLTRIELAEAIYRAVGISRAESRDILDAVLREITDALVSGETVKFSSFGTFSTRLKRQRVGRNPKSGEAYPITSRRVLSFNASPKLRQVTCSKATSPVLGKV